MQWWGLCSVGDCLVQSRTLSSVFQILGYEEVDLHGNEGGVQRPLLASLGHCMSIHVSGHKW